MAKLVGVDKTTIHNWERGFTKPPLRYIPRVLGFLGYDPDNMRSDTLDKRLLKHRRDNGSTQKELALQIGIDPTTLSRLERNRGRHFSSVLEKVNSYLFMESCSQCGSCPCFGGC